MINSRYVRIAIVLVYAIVFVIIGTLPVKSATALGSSYDCIRLESRDTQNPDSNRSFDAGSMIINVRKGTRLINLPLFDPPFESPITLPSPNLNYFAEFYPAKGSDYERGELYIMIPGKTPQHISSLQVGFTWMWLPDSSGLVYMDGTHDKPFYAIHFVATNLSQIIGEGGWGNLSPDGNFIALKSNQYSKDITLWSLGDFTAQTTISDTYAFFPPFWSPDGKYILYVKQDSETDFRLIVASVATGAEHSSLKLQKTKTEDFSEPPSFSPDGHYLLFYLFKLPRQGINREYIFGIDGETFTPFSSGLPEWIGNGADLLSVSSDHTLTNSNIYHLSGDKETISNLATSPDEFSTFPYDYNGEPRYSVKDNRIALVVSDTKGKEIISLSDLDGQNGTSIDIGDGIVQEITWVNNYILAKVYHGEKDYKLVWAKADGTDQHVLGGDKSIVDVGKLTTVSGNGSLLASFQGPSGFSVPLLLTLSTGETHHILDEIGYNLSAVPMWSPDKSKFVLWFNDSIFTFDANGKLLDTVYAVYDLYHSMRWIPCPTLP